MHDHDRGLSFDLSTLMTRRRALHLAAVGGLAAAVAGCGGSSSGSSDATTAAATTTGATGSAADAGGGATAEIPEETAGPFPGDGSNGANVLDRERHRPQRHHVELRRRPATVGRACR